MLEQADIPWRKLQPMEDPMEEQAPGKRGTHMGAGFLAETAACEGTMLEVSVPGGLYPLETINAGAVLEELQPIGRTQVRQVNEELFHVGGTPCGSRGRLRSSAPEEEGAAEMMCDDLTAAPILCPLSHSEGTHREN